MALGLAGPTTILTGEGTAGIALTGVDPSGEVAGTKCCKAEGAVGGGSADALISRENWQRGGLQSLWEL